MGDVASNGDWWERVERLERGIEHLLRVSAENSSRADDDVDSDEPLTKLIELQQRSAEHLNRVLDIVERSEEARQESEKRAEESRVEVDERLNALIKIVDELIRRQQPPRDDADPA
jgi:hypothetical protein